MPSLNFLVASSRNGFLRNSGCFLIGQFGTPVLSPRATPAPPHRLERNGPLGWGGGPPPLPQPHPAPGPSARDSSGKMRTPTTTGFHPWMPRTEPPASSYEGSCSSKSSHLEASQLNSSQLKSRQVESSPQRPGLIQKDADSNIMRIAPMDAPNGATSVEL